MELLADIGLYVLFLLEYAAYTFASAKLFNYLKADPARMLSLRVGQLSILLSIVHIGLSLLLLARVFGLVLLGLILLVYEFGVLVGLVARALLGTSVASSWFFGAELGARHPIAMFGGQGLLAVALLLGYPIGIGVAYFSLEKGSDELLFWVIALTAATVLLGVVWQLAISIPMLVSPYVNDDIRTQALVAQLMNIPQPALWIAIAYWASGEGDGGIGEANAREFGLVLAALVAVIVASTLLPYLVGAFRARRTLTHLLEREQRWWKRLAETAEIPMRPSYESDLRSLGQDLDRERKAFADEHETFFDFVEELRDPDTREELARAGLGVPAAFEIDELASSDPRTGFDATLERIERATGELLGEVETGHAAPAPSRELAEAWVEAARERRDEAEKAAGAARKTPARGRAAVSFVFAPVMAVVLDQFGVWIMEELSTLTS